MNQDTIRTLLALADACIQLGSEERPELAWLKKRHEQIQDKYHLKSRSGTDAFLYDRMYGYEPKKPSDTLKLRYWRTGKCTPGNRAQCLLYGDALELNDSEKSYLIQNYYDRGLDIYMSQSVETDPLYRARTERMNVLTTSYLAKLPDIRRKVLNIPSGQEWHYLRHLYFTDAFHYVYMPDITDETLEKHIISTRYDSEFTKQMKLLGEIPRKSMIRHLLILGLPELTLEKLNELLMYFGYLTLTQNHSMTGGERLDDLLIHLFQLYENQCQDYSADERLIWFQEACRILDAYFIKTDHPRLRFMYFKALNL